MMNRLVSVAAALACSATFAQAQPQPTQSVEVRGNIVRTDVRNLCPGIDNELQDALVNTVRDVATAAIVDVRFELRGDRVLSVATGDGPVRYQRALKRAVRGLQCDSKDAAPQQVALRVRFVDPFAKGSDPAVAMVSVLPASAAQR